MADETAVEIAQHFTAIGHSVDLINGIDAGTEYVEHENAEKHDKLIAKHFDLQVLPMLRVTISCKTNALNMH